MSHSQATKAAAALIVVWALSARAQTDPGVAIVAEEGVFEVIEALGCGGTACYLDTFTQFPSGYRVTSLSPLFGVVQELSGRASYLVDVSATNQLLFGPPRSEPIGFPDIEALAASGATIYAASTVKSGNTSALIAIDAGTGVGSKVGEAGDGISIVGLTLADDGVLYGVSRESEAPSKLYTIDTGTGAAAYLMDLPIACEALGQPLGDVVSSRLIGFGEGLCVVEPLSLEACELDYHPSCPSVGMITGSGGHYFNTPVRLNSWSEVKSRYVSDLPGKRMEPTAALGAGRSHSSR